MPEPSLLNNRYRLDEVIGSGGMAVVYRGRDQMLERTVAVKLLREDFSGDASFRERFRQEAMSAANLYHPNIVTIHDFGLDNGRFFIVMENIPGTDLKSMLVKRGRFSIEEAVDLTIQACAGIGYAHRAGLVHCDIKPHNILVTPDNRLKVADFGIARALATIRPDEKSSVVWGSPQYFSPEQASGLAPSPASDVYSLGVVLYEMLTGRLPFIATTATELARLHRETPPPPPRSINSNIPAGLEQIVLKVLSKEPVSRYRTADQMGRVLSTLKRPEAGGTAVRTASPAPAAAVREPEPPRSSASPAANRPKPARPAPARPAATYPARPRKEEPARPWGAEPARPEESPLDIDWGTLGLGLLALIAVGGLVPFWLWVYLLLNPAVR
jgi:eukaryotic-like serine/threonine-protein kinase